MQPTTCSRIRDDPAAYPVRKRLQEDSELVQVLNGANLSIFQGEITTIIGKSGMGKSVLLKHIIGLLEPDSGKILFQGRPLAEMKRAEVDQLKAKLSYVFQDTALFDSMSVYENTSPSLCEKQHLYLYRNRRFANTGLGQAEIIRPWKGIDHKYPSQLSGGMKKARSPWLGPW